MKETTAEIQLFFSGAWQNPQMITIKGQNNSDIISSCLKFYIQSKVVKRDAACRGSSCYSYKVLCVLECRFLRYVTLPVK